MNQNFASNFKVQPRQGSDSVQAMAVFCRKPLSAGRGCALQEATQYRLWLCAAGSHSVQAVAVRCRKQLSTGTGCTLSGPLASCGGHCSATTHSPPGPAHHWVGHPSQITQGRTEVVAAAGLTRNQEAVGCRSLSVQWVMTHDS